MTKSLPANPSLESLKKEAKSILKAYRKSDPSCCVVLRNLHHLKNRSDEEIFDSEISLQETQFALALEYGFRDWSELKRATEKQVIHKETEEPDMSTDWNLIREAMNATIDACEKLEKLEVKDSEAGDHRARWGDYENGVAVGDFFNRFWNYPEDASRDIIALKTKLNIEDRNLRPEIPRALIGAARACAEIIGVSPEDLDKTAEDFKAHCGTAGNSIKGQIDGIGSIYQKWMIPEITRAINEYRKKYSQENSK